MELVESRLPKEPADVVSRVSPPGPDRAGARFGIDPHRAELVQREHSAAFPDAPLVIEDRPRRRSLTASATSA